MINTDRQTQAHSHTLLCCSAEPSLLAGAPGFGQKKQETTMLYEKFDFLYSRSFAFAFEFAFTCCYFQCVYFCDDSDFRNGYNEQKTNNNNATPQLVFHVSHRAHSHSDEVFGLAFAFISSPETDVSFAQGTTRRHCRFFDQRVGVAIHIRLYLSTPKHVFEAFSQ